MVGSGHGHPSALEYVGSRARRMSSGASLPNRDMHSETDVRSGSWQPNSRTKTVEHLGYVGSLQRGAVHFHAAESFVDAILEVVAKSALDSQLQVPDTYT